MPTTTRRTPLGPVAGVVLVVALCALAWYVHGAGSPAQSSAVPAATSSATIAEGDLPLEARQTLVLIDLGGPFPFDQDGVVFYNREGHLPDEPDGYYTEYTVQTPGSADRGARRIIAGGPVDHPDVYYWTDDHYRSFERIVR